MWDSIREGLGSVLAFFYSIVPNSGVAIILLTVAVRLVLFPLTAKQAKSMIAMQRVQPEIKKLQAKYKNDRQKLNEEMMKFYKENEINPLGGCLPLLLQMPVFIALYQTLRDIQKFIPTDSKMFHDICGAAVKASKASSCKPKMSFAGLNLTTSASKAASSGFGTVWPYLVLVGFVVVTGFVQQRQTMRNQSQANPQMAIIGKIFPVVFAFITWGLPSGVGLYFATSNLWQIGQQEVVYRTMMNPAGAPPPKKGEGEIEGSKEPGGGTATKARGGPDGSGSGSGKGSDKPAGPKPGQSAARRAAGGGRPSAGAKGGANGSKTGGGAKGAASGTKDGGGQARPAGGARSNRKRKR
jgi:YidC/Oxa1 family membrane protein insertase